jgi:peptidoglycan/xylan/chitin deacetylase (PgdA/CDA1 family)
MTTAATTEDIERAGYEHLGAYHSKIYNPVESDFAGQAMVTFSYDDGTVSNYDTVLPLHETYGIPATFNIIAGRVDNEDFASTSFDSAMIIDSTIRGVEIASHSYNHADMTAETDEELLYDVSESLDVLSNIVNRVETISIPNSKYDDDVKAVVSQYFSGARVSGNALNAIPITDPFYIQSAIVVKKTTTYAEVVAVIDEAIANGKWCVLMLHGVYETATSTYHCTTAMLESILQYVSSFDKSVLLPVNTRDAIKYCSE